MIRRYKLASQVVEILEYPNTMPADSGVGLLSLPPTSWVLSLSGSKGRFAIGDSSTTFLRLPCCCVGLSTITHGTRAKSKPALIGQPAS